MNTAEFLKRKIKTLYEEEAMNKKSELAQLEVSDVTRNFGKGHITLVP
jgi:hypothetical protein